MKVECERCKTEYQFDDAIVSARGTTVRCTNCGHQFRVRRAEGEAGDDKFSVQRVDGTEITFESLRELQRAILSRAIVREDVLVRGAIKRQLGSIAELKPLFDERRMAASSRPPSAVRSTPPSTEPLFEKTLRMGSVPSLPLNPPSQAASHPSAKKSSVPPPPSGHDRAPLMAPPQAKAPSRPDGQPHENGGTHLAPKSPTLRPAGAALPPVPEATHRPQEPEPETVRRLPETDSEAETPVASAEQNFDATSPMAMRGRSSRPPPLPARASTRMRALTPAETPVATQTITAPLPIPQVAPPSLDMRPATRPSTRPSARPSSRPLQGSLRPSAATANTSVPPPPLSEGKRPMGGFIVGGVVVLCAGVLGVVFLRDRNEAKTPVPITTSTAATSASTPTTPMNDADARVARYLDTSKRALANGDIDGAKENADMASAIAETDPRVATQRVRVAVTRADLAWIAMQAQPAKGPETKIAADRLTDASTRLANVDRAHCGPACLADLERLLGNLPAARDKAKAIPEPGGVDGKYARAAVALADKRWDGVVSELADATSDASFGARERALLSLGYARASSFDKARLALSGGAMPAYVATAISALLPPDTRADAAAGAAPAGSGATGAELVGADPRDILKAADQARSKGEYDRALRLYSIALDRNSRDSEALNGIAEVEHATRNLAAARASYQRVLSVNGSYLPALLGAADVEYESGNLAGAQKIYKDITDRFPEGAYPARVKQRSGEAPPAPKPIESAAPPVTPPPTPTASATTAEQAP